MTFAAAVPILAAMAVSTVPLQLFRRFIAPLLLLVISVHALTPLGQPLQRVSGSAFSAETVEVSLRSGQRGQVIKQAEAPKPMLADLPVTAPMPRQAEVSAARSVIPGLGPTGPPPASRTIFSPLSPRAPPAA
ncbi:hypothetical protein WG901_01190 [Novosphingobium sp. PS1R-30]|uniref:Uncharacterized protein n=1 Tax=Novosphingobium anseongense TaxID=3133436 RepID=A0ABU8RQF7_9SPHN|nr:MAG: hypothetical protein EOO76_07110 [Novosphingobium sp.]